MKPQIAFSAEELRPLIPMHDGDIFSSLKVREGLEALFNYYRAHGYIDFVPEPKFKIDEVRQQITLVISLQEGPQYRLGNIEIVGLDPAQCCSSFVQLLDRSQNVVLAWS